MFRLFVMAVLTTTLTACGGLGIKRPVATEDLPKIKRVGVASWLGDTFYGISIGTTVFNNEYFSATVPDWEVDKIAVGKTLAMLRASKSFESAAFDRSGVSVELLKSDGKKQLWDAARRQGFDTLVILFPQVSGNAQFFKPGFGLFERSMFGSSRRCVYAGYTLEVYEVNSGSALGWEWGGGDSIPCVLGSDNDLPFRAKFDDYPHRSKTRDPGAA